MAQVRRMSGRPRAAGGGKLALFEVLQAGSDDGTAEVSSPAPAREPPTAPPARRAAPEAVVFRTPGPGRSLAASRFGLALAGVGVLALILAGAMLTSALSGSPRPQLAGEAMPEVLDVGGPRRSGVAALPDSSAQTLANRHSETEVQVTQSAAPLVVPADFRRVNGLNYVLVQSYHPSEEDRAIATRDALLAAGIGATLERNVPGWNRNICVVGTVGFERLKNNPEYQAYKAALEKVSEQNRGNRKIKTFEPSPVQWSRN